MTGLLYKEFRQHRLLLLTAVLVPPVLILLMPFLGASSETDTVQKAFLWMNKSGGLMLRFTLLMIGYVLISTLSALPFMIDETKKWAYFTASHPKGSRGHVRMKYAFVLMLYGLYLVSALVSDWILQMIFRHSTGEALMSLRNVMLMMFFLQMIGKGIGIPFILRFGIKNSGNKIAAVLGAAVFGMLIFILFGPAASYEAMMNGAVHMLEQFSMRRLKSMISAATAAIPVIAAAGYLLSCCISCKVYMKGAAAYTK